MTKRFSMILAVLVMVTSSTLFAQWRALGFEQITVGATAIGFTTTQITTASGIQMTVATCYLETGEVRYRIDGPAPTSSVGTPWPVNTSLTFVGHDVLSNFLAIRDSGTSGTLDCNYSAGTGH